MPIPDLTEDEHAEIVRVLRDAIDGDRHFMSPRIRRLKSILAKVDPATAKPVVAQDPPPRRSGEPSLLIRSCGAAGGDDDSMVSPQPRRPSRRKR